MNLTKIIIISLLFLLIAGCTQLQTKGEPGKPPSFIPPPPVPQGPIGRAASPGFAEPVDIFDNNAVVIKQISQLKADPSTGVQNIPAEITRQGGWIWNEAYRFNAKTYAWEKFLLDGTPYPGTQWIANNANKILSQTPFDTVRIDTPDGNAVIAFTCKQYPTGGEWKCGCTTTTETAPCLKWMMRTFTIIRETPPVTPGTPGASPTPTPTATPTGTPTPTPTTTPTATPTTTPSTWFAHCSIDIEKPDGTYLKNTGGQDITDANALQACAGLKVFGKDANTALANTEYDWNVMTGEVTEASATPGDSPLLECRLPCSATGANLAKFCLNSAYDSSLPPDSTIYNTLYEQDLGINPETIC